MHRGPCKCIAACANNAAAVLLSAQYAGARRHTNYSAEAARLRPTSHASLNHIKNFSKGSPARASEVAAPTAAVELLMLHSKR